jgi:hypothetical protein
MKRLFLSICFLFFANYLLAQSIDYTYTERGGKVIVTGLANANVTELVIHDFLPGTTKPITEINKEAFDFERELTSVVIGNNVTKIGQGAFELCTQLTSVVIGNSVTDIAKDAFNNCQNLTSIVIPASVTNIGNSAFNGCNNLTSITFLGTTPPGIAGGQMTFYLTNITTVNVPIGSTGYDILSNYIPNYNSCTKNYQIKQGETYTLSSSLVLDANTALDNKGLLVIAQGGELVPSNNNLGIVEVETSSLPIGWHFIGAPFAGYALQSIVPRLDPSVCLFDYSNTNAWNDYWATINDNVSKGEGFFAYSWSNDKIIFTNYGDGMYSPNANSSYDSYNYNYSATPAYQINTGDVDVTKTLAGSSDAGHWMALANPYTFKLNVATFISDQGNAIQGEVSYRLNGESWQTVTEGVINVTEGFFVNFANGGSQTAHFKTSQRLGANKKASVEREFIRLAMLEGEREIELLFAQNEDANEGYDIFDANKLFSPVEITEPYFVTNNIALVKEEVNTLPYYATMNVRSYENKEVKFKANYIPEGYSLSLIDGEETIDLTEGVEYATNVMAGENANRFKVLIKKSLSIEDVEELQVNIYNDNRNINIETLESDLQIEVYNALGQKVFATKDRNFMLNNVSAGAYLVKAFSKTASKTQKIVVK